MGSKGYRGVSFHRRDAQGEGRGAESLLRRTKPGSAREWPEWSCRLAGRACVFGGVSLRRQTTTRTPLAKFSFFSHFFFLIKRSYRAWGKRMRKKLKGGKNKTTHSKAALLQTSKIIMARTTVFQNLQPSYTQGVHYFYIPPPKKLASKNVWDELLVPFQKKTLKKNIYTQPFTCFFCHVNNKVKWILMFEIMKERESSR